SDVPIGKRPSGSDRVDAFKATAEDRFARPAKPAFEKRRVDLAKISVEFDVAVFQIVEVWMLAHQPGSHSRTGEKHRSRSDVIRALTCVFLDAASELAERHHQSPPAVTMVLDIVNKRVNGFSKLPQ